MRSIFAALVCALFLVAARPAQSLGDALDDLLSSPAVASPHEPASSSHESASDAAEHFDLLDNDSSSYSDHSRWHAVSDISSSGTSKGKSHSDDSAQKSAPLGGLNLVPEPSAVALAGLALLYFLVFGRRRVFK